MHYAFLLKYAAARVMSLPDGIGPAFEIHFDEAGRPRRLVATKDEAAVALEAFESMRRMLNHQIDDAPSRVATAPAPRVASAPAAEASAAPTISQAFEDFAKLQRASAEWSDETLRYTHAPTIKLFRELVGEVRPHSGSEGAVECDLTLDRLDKERIDRFLEEFWRRCRSILGSSNSGVPRLRRA